MTRRIAIAILLTVWALLIAVGLAAYFTTRSVLLAGLDAALVRGALARPGDRWIVKDPTGRTVDRPAPAQANPQENPLIEAHFSRSPDGELLRTVTVRAPKPTPQRDAPPIVYTGSAAEFEQLLRRLAWTLGAVGLVAGLLAAAVAVRVSRLALRPLRATAQQIATIDEGRLDQRIATDLLPVELLPMAGKLNEMLARLQEAFELRRRFLADASHELRTPVAALVTTLEVSLARARTAEAYKATLETCLDDAALLRKLVERLMEQVRSQTLSADEAPARVDVSDLLNSCATLLDPIAETRQVRIGRHIPTKLVGFSHRERLRSIIINLLSNAVEYNRPGGSIELSCTCNGDGLTLKVCDTGIGIRPDDLPHVFEPFFRGDKSRRQEAGHLGLGLSMVQANVKAMGGQIEVQSEAGVGTTFTIRFPSFHEMAAMEYEVA